MEELVGLAVALGVGVAVDEGLNVGEGIGVDVAEGLAVGDGVALEVDVGDGVGVAAAGVPMTSRSKVTMLLSS